MIRLPPLGFVLPVLTALGVTLALIPEGYVPAPMVTNAVLGAARAASVSALPPLSDVAAVESVFAERPLLAEDRRAPQVSAVQASEPALAVEMPVAVPDPLAPTAPRIAGLITADGQTRVLLRDAVSGKESWTRLGETVGGWTLIEITQMTAILEAQGVQVTVQLFQDRLP